MVLLIQGVETPTIPSPPFPFCDSFRLRARGPLPTACGFWEQNARRVSFGRTLLYRGLVERCDFDQSRNARPIPTRGVDEKKGGSPDVDAAHSRWPDELARVGRVGETANDGDHALFDRDRAKAGDNPWPA